MSGGGGTQTSTQKSSSESGPPSYIQPYLQQGTHDLWQYYQANQNAPAYYGGETVAPLSTQSQGAVNMASGLAGNNPTLGAANTQLTDTLNGKYLDPTSNPQFQSALSASHQPYIDQFNSQILPGVTSAFEGSGRTGSGLHQASVDQATTNLNRTISDSDAQAGSKYYTDARGQQIAAAGLTPGVNSANWQDVAGLGTAGSTVDTQRQAQDTSDQAKYNYNSTSQIDYINKILASFNAGYPGGQTNSNSTATQSIPQSSPWGAIFSGAGLGLQAASMFSDERLKEDIEPVGALNDGQTVYSYRYKGDPMPRIGLMAQEVAERHPEAVHVDPASGFLKVNYDAATVDARKGLF